MSYLKSKLAADPTFGDNLVPAYIMVKLTDEQASELEGVNNSQTIFRNELTGEDDYEENEESGENRLVATAKFLFAVKGGGISS